MAHAQGAPGEHELPLADRHRLGTDDPRVDRPAGDPEHQDHVRQAWSEDRDDRQRQQHEGKGQHHVDQRHDRPVGAAAKVAGAEPEQHADGRRDQHRAGSHHQGDAAAVDDARQEIAPHLIGTKEVPCGTAFHPGRGRQAVTDVHGQRIVGRDLRSEDGTRDDEQEDGAGGQAPAQPAKAGRQPSPGRAGARGAELGQLHLGLSAHRLFTCGPGFAGRSGPR